MPVPSSLTLNYDALLSTTLFNWAKTLYDQISATNAFFYHIRKQEGGYKEVSDLGERAAVPVMYELGTADFYAGYDTLATTPMDGITSAFYDWTQMSVPISISRIEERKNAGQEKILDLLDSKIKQAKTGIMELFGKALLQGQGANGGALTTAYTSAVTGAVGFDPLPKVIAKTNTNTVGNISGSTYTWWRNTTTESTGSTFAAQWKELVKLYNDTSKGAGGFPDLHLVDQNVAEWYEGTLRSQNRFTDYSKADLPFGAYVFRGKPVIWDQFMPDWENGDTTLTTTTGTWLMINSKFWEIRVDKETNFLTRPFQTPDNQDAKVAHIMWYGTVCTKARRKQGVLWGIDTTVAS